MPNIPCARLQPRAALTLVLLSTLGALACRTASPGQGVRMAVPSTGAEAVERIAREALTRGQTYDALAELCAVAPSRLSGSEGAARAVEWSAERMRTLGFDEVRLEPCTVPVWRRGLTEELVVTAPADLAGTRLPILALGGSVATPPAGVEASLVIVQDLEELARRTEEVAGAIVLTARPMDASLLDPFEAYGGAVDQRSQGAAAAAREGAVAHLVRSMTSSRDDVPHTGGMRYADGVERIPSAALSTNAADLLAARVAAGDEVRLRLTLDCETLPPAPSFNVVGELRGRELPEEIVLVSGHLDAWDVGQGAHDCGGGCMQAVETVRLLLALDLRPRRTIRVVLYMNEENGTAGARAYAAAHADELGRHVLAIESDRGVFTPRGFQADAAPGAVAALRPLVDLVGASTGATALTTGFAGVDIGPLKPGGVPLVGYVPDPQRYFDLHHSANDTMDAVHRREIELGSAAIAALAFLVAEAEDVLPRTPRD